MVRTIKSKRDKNKELIHLFRDKNESSSSVRTQNFVNRFSTGCELTNNFN